MNRKVKVRHSTIRARLEIPPIPNKLRKINFFGRALFRLLTEISSVRLGGFKNCFNCGKKYYAIITFLHSFAFLKAFFTL